MAVTKNHTVTNSHKIRASLCGNAHKLAVKQCHKRSQTEEERAWGEGECRRRAGCRTEKLHVRMTRALLKAEGTDGPSSSAPVKTRSRWSAQNRFRTFGHLLKGTGREKKMETQISTTRRSGKAEQWALAQTTLSFENPVQKLDYVFINDSLFQSLRKKQHADPESRTVGSLSHNNFMLRESRPKNLITFP